MQQLDEYLQGSRRYFSIPVWYKGTHFQEIVWSEVARIDYSSRATYKDIAIAINSPDACRAVGNAVKANPLPIIIPCHRIVASNGQLGGFSSGRWRKKWLLEHEDSNI